MSLAFIGSRVIVASSPNGQPETGMLLMALGVVLIGPLGVGAILASAAGFVILRGFTLRSLLIATAGCGIGVAAFLSFTWPWSSDRITFDKRTGELRYSPPSTIVSSNSTTGTFTMIGEIHIVRVYGPGAISLIIGGLPFLSLPVMFKWRVRTRGPSSDLRKSADNFGPRIQEKKKQSTDAADGPDNEGTSPFTPA